VKSLADYHDERIAELGAIERLADATDLFVLQGAVLGLQVERLKFATAVRQAFG
jgi:hypothetical protein